MGDADSRLRPNDPAVRRDVVKLLDYVRSTAGAGRAVLDIKDHEGVWWLCELPEGLEFRQNPSPDGSLLRVPYLPVPAVRSLPQPLRDYLDEGIWADATLANAKVRDHLAAAVDSGSVRVTTLNSALTERQAWLDKMEQTRPHGELYEKMREVAHNLDSRDDEFELVLCSGLFVGKDPKEGPVRRHLLTRRCWVRVDKKSSAVVLGADPDTKTQIEDNRFLVGTFGDRLKLVDAIREAVSESEVLPHGPEVSDWLTDWTHRMLPDGGAFNPSAHPPSGGSLPMAVTAAPALVLRKRDRSGVASFLEQILDQLRSGRADVPLGLFQLLYTPDEDHQRSWLASLGVDADMLLNNDPLFHRETNAEQRQVLDRVRRFNGAVVQGPPGTGKTHTIANLLCAMLSDGLRVLVVSQREQPLRVLRDKLPKDMQPLCMSTVAKRGSESALEAGTRAMAARMSQASRANVGAEVGRLLEQRRVLQADVVALEVELANLLHSEHERYPDIAPGYGGLLAEIAESVADQATNHAWFPALPADAPTVCPLTTPQLHALLALARANPDGAVRAGQVVPAAELVPRVSSVAEALDAIARQPAVCEQGPLAEKLIRVDGDQLRTWHQDAQRVIDLIKYLDEVANQGFPVVGNAMIGILSDNNAEAWADVLDHSGQATDLWRRRRSPELQGVRPTAQTPEEWNTLYTRTKTLSEQAKHLKSGLEQNLLLRNKFWKTQTEFGKATSDVRNAFTFQGSEPTDPVAARAVDDYLEVLVGMQTLDHVWQFVTEPRDWASEEGQRLRRRSEIDRYLPTLRELADKSSAVRSSLSKQAVLAILSIPDAWRELVAAIESVLVEQQIDVSRRSYDGWISQLKFFVENTDSAPETTVLLKALESRDVDAYRAAFDDLSRAQAVVAEHERYRDLLEVLGGAHAELARELAGTSEDRAWDSRIDQMVDTWSWAVADRFLRQKHQPELTARREAELVARKTQLRQTTAKLATELAWDHCLKSMSPEQQRALKTFEVLSQKQTRGRGKYTQDYRRAAKKAMEAARDAVPAWVMPIPKVAESMPAEQNSFDVVIVDEASQAAMSSIFLLWLAPRIVIVGDDQQCAPQSSRADLGQAQKKLSLDFPNIAEDVRMLLMPNGNLYNILGCAFPNTVTLTEHFRCMPEIIDWPSQEFYGGRLVPLRQYGADRLEPIVVERVENGDATGSNEKLINPAEAEHIVTTIEKCIADPAYAGKTFGIIALQSRGQRNLIQHLLLQRVPAEDIDGREITVGSSAEFQGDERDVMIVSTVHSGHVRQMKMDKRYQRDINVAVSRARDQLRIITSLTDSELGPEDIRHKMIAHYRSKQDHKDWPSADDYPNDALRPPFTSLFPQRVYHAIVERGYHARPNVAVGDRRLDIVIYGENSAVAVVCDRHTGAAAEVLKNETESLRELQRAGWPFHRIAHSQFTLDSDTALTPLWRLLEQNDVHPASRKG